MLIEIPGDPQSDSRPRTKKVRDMVWIYDCKASEKQTVKKIMMCQLDQLDSREISEAKSFGVYFCFYMPVPKSWSQKKRLAALNGDISHNCKPDLDNLIKFYLDCMNKIIFNDDAKVIHISAQKIYGLEPRTKIRIYQEINNVTE